jgi:Plavaka transposase
MPFLGLPVCLWRVHCRHLCRLGDVWQESIIQIPVPDGQKHHQPTDPPIPCFDVPGLHHRSLTKTIKATWSDQDASCYHYTPFRQFWKRRSGAVESVFEELYSSEAFIQEHEAMQNLPPEPGCTLERSVCAIMFWSDSTHSASFGSASLWPIYLMFGNQSKYMRSNTTGRSSPCHHIAYIPKVSWSLFFSFVYVRSDA